jgi:hypothetical protein
LVESFTVAQIPHFDLHKRPQITRRAVLRLHHEMRLIVELDDLASANVVGGGHNVDDLMLRVATCERKRVKRSSFRTVKARIGYARPSVIQDPPFN